MRGALDHTIYTNISIIGAIYLLYVPIYWPSILHSHSMFTKCILFAEGLQRCIKHCIHPIKQSHSLIKSEKHKTVKCHGSVRTRITRAPSVSTNYTSSIWFETSLNSVRQFLPLYSNICYKY